VTLTVQNLDDGPAPAGLGLHPYFPRAGATLRFAATDVWLNGDDALPARAVPVPSEWDHAAGRVVGTVALDNCFAGWDGQARIGWSNGLALQIQASDALRHLIVYTPPGQDFFCVEPVSHLTDAINRVAGLPEHGLRVLAPGAVLQAEVILRITTVR
jgi:aldose 1-epimerase